jgi:hypothetical protein
MAHHSTGPPRLALVNRTNVHAEKIHRGASQEHQKKLAKRPSSLVHDRITKRAKIIVSDNEEESEESEICDESDSDIEVDDIAVTKARRRTTFYNIPAIGLPCSSWFRPSGLSFVHLCVRENS